MSNLECNMINNLVADEEQSLSIDSQIFLKQYFEAMDEANKQLYKDLMMEQRETM